METSPLEEHDQLTVGELQDEVKPFGNAIGELSDSKVNERLELVQAIREYESENKDRVTALESIDKVLSNIQDEAEERGLVEDEEPDVADSSSDEEVVEEETEDEESEDDEEPTTTEQMVYRGADGSARVLVRNPDRTAKNVAGYGFDAGEVKDMKATDRIKQAIRQGDLQTVKG